MRRGDDEQMSESWRSFVAIDLPDAGRRRVARELEELKRVGADVRWVREDQLHLTLQFLADVPVETMENVRDRLRLVADRHDPFALRLLGLGRFPPRGRPTVFWMGIDGALDELRALARDVEGSLEPLGFEPQKRAFHPHVTLGRVRGFRRLREVEALIAARSGDVDLPMEPIRGLRLYRSELRPEGARYTLVEEFALGGSSADS
jgi:2'-5' RNA ligase